MHPAVHAELSLKYFNSHIPNKLQLAHAIMFLTVQGTRFILCMSGASIDPIQDTLLSQDLASLVLLKRRQCKEAGF